ncbi:MAG: GAF domain-containing protein [Syntrophobacteraceae bacterium]|jgi:GAF domain-containing protein|nr:GAF domain-containing protein [Syntrophobacteraceae bacterium]
MGMDAEYYRIFQEMSKTIGSTLSVEQRLNKLAEGMVKALGVKGCTIRLMDEARGTLELAASHGLSDEYFKKGAVQADLSIAEAMVGRTVVIGDARTDPRIQYPGAAVREGIVSILSIPIIIRGRVAGVLKLHATEEKTFTPEEIELATSLAEHGAVAIDNARLLDQAFNEIQYLKAVTEVAKTLSSTLDAARVLELIVTRVASTLRVQACSLRLLNPATGRLELAVSHGLSPAYLGKGPVDRDKSIASSMDGEVVSILDASTDPRLQYPDEARREGIASILSVPVFLKDKVIGVLRLYSTAPRKFSGSEIELAQSMAEFGALALQNARLHESLRLGSPSVMEEVFA